MMRLGSGGSEAPSPAGRRAGGAWLAVKGGPTAAGVMCLIAFSRSAAAFGFAGLGLGSITLGGSALACGLDMAGAGECADEPAEPVPFQMESADHWPFAIAERLTPLAFQPANPDVGSMLRKDPFDMDESCGWGSKPAAMGGSAAGSAGCSAPDG